MTDNLLGCCLTHVVASILVSTATLTPLAVRSQSLAESFQWNDKWSCEHNYKYWYVLVRADIMREWKQKDAELLDEAYDAIFEGAIEGAILGLPESPLTPTQAILLGAFAKSMIYLKRSAESAYENWNDLAYYRQERDRAIAEECNNATSDDITPYVDPSVGLMEPNDEDEIQQYALVSDRTGSTNCTYPTAIKPGDIHLIDRPLCEHQFLLTKTCISDAESNEARRQLIVFKRLLGGSVKKYNTNMTPEQVIAANKYAVALYNAAHQQVRNASNSTSC